MYQYVRSVIIFCWIVFSSLSLILITAIVISKKESSYSLLSIDFGWIVTKLIQNFLALRLWFMLFNRVVIRKSLIKQALSKKFFENSWPKEKPHSFQQNFENTWICFYLYCGGKPHIWKWVVAKKFHQVVCHMKSQICLTEAR